MAVKRTWTFFRNCNLEQFRDAMAAFVKDIQAMPKDDVQRLHCRREPVTDDFIVELD